MNLKTFSAIPLSLSLLVGCSSETTESENVKTEAIWADIYVTSQGEDSRVIAELNVSSRNGNNIKLSDKDKLHATAAGITKDLEIDDGFLDIDYRATFNVAEKDTKFMITLTRGESNDTLQTELILPAPFSIITPQKNQSFYKQDTLEVNWTSDNATDTRLDALLTLRCKNKDGNEESIAKQYSDITDDGSFSVDLSSLDGIDSETLNDKKSCEADIYMERIRYSSLDSRYAEGSRARAIQERYSDKFEVRLFQ
ncbi:hypothetical protein [Pseudoalteromonas luteoviolacea]|uniref:Lipoprotein n=1 Tax=Pseudoalteromonas luteoviolacea S4054 TaxID=1129367 RepID=A0A0F6AE90_9GAMM|nr:hypothetical protein [Pseudoalteromonas luteoviolacea]AOT11185.1 hypothetical protein S4054249_25495 [Pseudoalteromonas luteoviolacea]AOT15651.1 hypothetical protein S40542_23015 [Pseudoalteromonas luteoviolacea]AOT21006.1 hypothetical protein S4054_25415 [Pseudoalteromonas luteoviolacea]KKE84532.1 hypothetical protein N479_08180 [Pseudoalteromonas luteoviolacea S4054]KZN71323.1 hypothetical protein N481_19240 [Pseudoalteromonas luteoviolacea S4047-1]